ncbi:hypothetical protein PHMEG_00026162 [Phytophthora megakarya]|uniref:Uncharacterized protein n=1 Tax=Phytophthora megakarya TaxID=4795 RepID=A0A225VBG1_9STRA|nr:hypothetical protein PHMEG_00026162 [Phytophthora megakarya]
MENLYRQVAATKCTPYQLAYPWEGSKLWYDPEVYPFVYLAHRSWWDHDWRSTHALLGQTRRWKQKMEAATNRVKFLNCCINTWGFDDFLQLLDDCNDSTMIMWWGGQPGRNQSRGPGYHGPVIESLTFLRRRTASEYDSKMINALTLFRIDEGGFSSVTALLL